MEEKYLKTIKKGFFIKFINFFKAFFVKKESPSETKPQKVRLEETSKSNFLDAIQLNKIEPPELLEIQKKLENKEISLLNLSDEELEKISLLYKRQIENLKKEIDIKEAELTILKAKTNRCLKTI